jgi:hypothetical protein
LKSGYFFEHDVNPYVSVLSRLRRTVMMFGGLPHGLSGAPTCAQKLHSKYGKIERKLFQDIPSQNRCTAFSALALKKSYLAA